MADIFDDYQPAAAWDEMFERAGVPRAAYGPVLAALQPLDPAELRFRADQLARVFTDRGVTFDYAGEERPFPLDLIPRVLDALEWPTLERGVRQRVLALESFLADVYGPGEIFKDGLVPWRLISTSAHFHREVSGLTPPNGVRAHISGIDLIRDEDGRFRVLEDNVRTPSGVSYVMENRLAMTRTFPGLFAEQHVHPVDEYPARLLAALRASAPRDVADPVVAVLTPGVGNAAYFEHTLLARLMGVELVEGRDLICAGNRVYIQTTQGRRPVHVIYRRIDDAYLDPLHFNGGSVIGCPGIVNAARAGNLTIANAVGNGVADDKLIYTYVPEMIRYYLGEEPVLDNVESYRLEDPDVISWVLDRLDRLVLKPVDGAGGKGIVIGPHADAATLEALRETVVRDPRGWLAQRPVSLSTVPTLTDRGPAPRHVDLRPFAVNDGEDVWVLPGGLTRVALPEGELVVNSSQGGGSKDTWVLAADRSSAQAPEDPPIPLPRTFADVTVPQGGPGHGSTIEGAQQQ
ncbi:putative circularly permuted ATP-grasp superfamily protein [Actinocorallia herbida]|uniref:Putative circularly permuted ATP-grasp superfamily protein n=1 Tax=Actinocorallia herbida TaxID=58109 RepID=A0A3N1CRF7_9ACTN|nr:circularly permuted type 2 ATP-grasp protein [Actinocorallia herbida]ROO83734.1 putative circularly permuted ATP-grasp superfamily protein [Actinocorallia herbida]